MKKKCETCGKTKLLTEFGKNKSKKDGVQHQCKICYNEYFRNYMKKNMSTHAGRVKKNKYNYRKKFAEYKTEIGCQLCGYNTCEASLHFHHLDPSTKSDNITRLVSKSYRVETVIDEINKCILVCANCHGEIESDLIDLSDYEPNLPPIVLNGRE